MHGCRGGLPQRGESGQAGCHTSHSKPVAFVRHALGVNRDLMTRILEFQVTFPVRHRLCRCREAVGRVQSPPLDARIGRGQARDHRVQREVDEGQNDAPGAAEILQARGMDGRWTAPSGLSVSSPTPSGRGIDSSTGPRSRATRRTQGLHAAGAAGVGTRVCAPGSPRGRPRSTRGTVRTADR